MAPTMEGVHRVDVVSVVPASAAPSPANAVTVVVTLPPGSAGSPPHRHPGPVFGYVIEGEVLFEVEGQPERVIAAGESFWEAGGDVIHYQDANHLRDAESRFLALLFVPPGEPVLVPVSEEELAERASRRAPRPGASETLTG